MACTMFWEDAAQAVPTTASPGPSHPASLIAPNIFISFTLPFNLHTNLYSTKVLHSFEVDCIKKTVSQNENLKRFFLNVMATVVGRS